MKILIINTHLTYQGWSEGKLKTSRLWKSQRRSLSSEGDHDKSKFLSLSLMLYIT
jgi:hypothetical protein